MRIALIGNSHLGALKGGWESPGFDKGGIEAVFFGAPGNGLGDMVVREGALFASTDESRRYMSTTSGGLDRVAANYDGYVLVGYFGIGFVADVFVGHRPPDHVNANQAPASRAALRAAARDALVHTPALHLLRQLRKLTQAPVVLVSDPMPNPRIRDTDKFGRWGADILPLVAESYAEALRTLAETSGAKVITQPDGTVLAPAFTEPRYALDHAEHGLRHMTPEYGALVMQDVVAAFKEGP
ncbi:hypothetical protein [Roseomonas indoligenes]|uniref:Uncharacterized protein n=1 Tax=Roseomonas indoligenes TaxID=2820811 RepID=A0A940N3D1_9PROT|nr:hypothetical protein [Pararoseomonas indoligenes]MBP0495271.1 hypothetical protein [Pararoseomonas indoligenes]